MTSLDVDNHAGSMTGTSNTDTRHEADDIRFEIRDGMRRVTCIVSNEALETASGLPEQSSPTLRRRSFDRFRTLIHAAAALRLAALPPGFVGPIILTTRDLRSVPHEWGTPVLGSPARASARPEAHAEASAAADAAVWRK